MNKQNLFLKFIVLTALFALGAAAARAQSNSQEYRCLGVPQYFSVPPGVTQITATAIGSSGTTALYSDRISDGVVEGGRGATLQSTINVVPGQGCGSKSDVGPDTDSRAAAWWLFGMMDKDILTLFASAAAAQAAYRFAGTPDYRNVNTAAFRRIIEAQTFAVFRRSIPNLLTGFRSTDFCRSRRFLTISRRRLFGYRSARQSRTAITAGIARTSPARGR